MAIPPSRTLSPGTFLRREPRQVRSAERLETLVAAAADLLVTDGYPGVTAAALSSRTEMPHSTIYDVVGDPRDLVAVYALRVLDEMHDGLLALAEQIDDEDAAVAFVKFIVAAYFDAYRTNATLRAALSGLDADPSYRWINLADSERNAHVIAAVIQRFSVEDPVVVFERCLLMAHLTGATAAMAVDLGEPAGDNIIARFDDLVDALLGR